MATGWIKLHRQIMECDMWDSEDEPFDKRSAWIDLLLLANHRDKMIVFNRKPLTVGAGQRITSIRKLGERWNWSTNKVRRYLDTLEELGMITRESDNKKTLLTIVNYGKYQSEPHTDEYADDTQTNTQTIHRRNTNKNIKNDKNEKNEKNKKKIYGEYAHVRLSDQEHEKLVGEYGNQTTDDCIRYLDEYIEMKGYKAKSHYLCIRKWVLNAVNERRKKPLNKTAERLEDDKAWIAKWATEGEDVQ